MNTVETLRKYQPGFLAEPLSWISETLDSFVFEDPALLRTMMALSPIQLHRFALALSLTNPPYAVTYIREQLLTPTLQKEAEIRGLTRALSILPRKVLPPECYRTLIALLQDRSTARWMFHTKSLDETTIRTLQGLPACFRKLGFYQLIEQDIPGLDRLCDGLALLAGRLGRDVESITKELGALDQPEQIIAYICKVVGALPLVQPAPPAFVEDFRRLDHAADIKAVAKEWRNCLASLIPQINNGEFLVYLAPDRAPPAAALLSRAGRLGWVVEQIRGPSNREFEPSIELRMMEAFDKANVPNRKKVAALREMVFRGT